MDPNIIATIDNTSMMDSNALYYTFSTIAQTLGGAFGILGAFVLFRLQSLNQSIFYICDILHTSYNPPSQENGGENREKFNEAFINKDWETFIHYLEITVIGDRDEKIPRQRVSCNQLIHSLKAYLNNKILILNILKYAVWLTVITIILSIIILPFTPTLINHSRISTCLLLLLIVATLICLTMYVKLIYTVLLEGISDNKESITNKLYSYIKLNICAIYERFCRKKA